MRWLSRSFLLLAALAAACSPPPTPPGVKAPASDVPTVLGEVEVVSPVDIGSDANDGTTGTDASGGGPTSIDFGKACEQPDDCTSGYCIESQIGKVCSEPCIEKCPSGFGCEQVFLTGGDLTLVCVPRFIRLCRPCKADADCRIGILENQKDLCLSFGDAGSFCGGDCTKSTCPEGYECSDKTLPGGDTARQCVPADGALCACRPQWAPLNLETACKVANEFGACPGTRSCASTGLTSCSGAVPGAELCDGQDNDCDGQTDEAASKPCKVTNDFGTCTGQEVCGAGGSSCDASTPAPEVCNKIDDDCDGAVDNETCSDGIGCTDDLCLDDGDCGHPVSKGACFIDGSCYLAGAASSLDPCQQCLPEVSATSWSSAEGALCDDGIACTQGDTCTAGACAGSTYVCDDGLLCTADTCDGAGGCLYVTAPGTCAIGTSCWSKGDENSDNACLSCQPDTSSTEWSPMNGALCNDGDPCSANDGCVQDVCSGTKYDCDDSVICTEDVCVGDGSCVHLPTAEGAACDDSDSCSANDVCTGGVCTGKVYSCSDGQGCTADICDGKGGCAFNPIQEGAACDDGDKCSVGEVCTAGQCAGAAVDCAALTDQCNTGACDPGTGQCVGLAKAGTCDDQNACTHNDTCQGGACLGIPVDCSALSTACVEGVCVQGACQKKQLDGACDDGDACTLEDDCQAGQCVGFAKDCGAASDPCNNGVCIGGTCEKSPVQGPCNDGSACTSSDACQAGMCVGTPKDCSYLSDKCVQGVCNAGGTCEKKLLVGGCDDGDACTDNDSCQNGSCLGQMKSCDSLGDQCNLGVCVQGACKKQPVVGPCSDGNLCTLGDTCQGGTCAGSTKDCSFLSDTCNVGTCVAGSCQKQSLSGGCDDGDACTVNDACNGGSCGGKPKDCTYLDTDCTKGVCQGGTCTSINKSGFCSDGNACTLNDACSNGQCVGSPKDCSQLSDVCNEGYCSNGTCLKQAKSASCNDFDACTVNDACNGGVCKGTPMSCSYLNDQCNQGYCSGGACLKSPLNQSCTDGDPCSQNDKCVGGACLGTQLNCSGLSDSCNTGVCAGGSCTKQPKAGTCNDNEVCTTSDTCSNGICSGTPKLDAYEPNNSYNTEKIAGTTDCSGLDNSLTATIYPSGDVDWFWLDYDDTGSIVPCDTEPKATLTMPAGVNYDLCVFYECKSGATVSISCINGTAAAGPTAKSKGCCSKNSGSTAETVRMSTDCNGTINEDAYIDIKVTPVSGATCTGYTLSWGDS